MDRLSHATVRAHPGSRGRSIRDREFEGGLNLCETYSLDSLSSFGGRRGTFSASWHTLHSFLPSLAMISATRSLHASHLITLTIASDTTMLIARSLHCMIVVLRFWYDSSQKKLQAPGCEVKSAAARDADYLDGLVCGRPREARFCT